MTHFFCFSRSMSIKLSSNSAELPKLVEMSTKVGSDPVVIPKKSGTYV